MGREKILIAVLLLAALLPAAYAQWGSGTSAASSSVPWQSEINATSNGVFNAYKCVSTQNYWDQWMPLTFLALLISVFIIGGVYMIGKGFEIHAVHAWAKNELYQTFGTAVIVVLLVVGLPIADEAGKSISYMYADSSVHGHTSIEMAMDYSRTVANLMAVNFAGLTLINAIITLFGSLPISMAAGGIAGATFSLEPIVRPILHFIGVMVTLMVTVMGEWQAHWFVLCFIKQRMLFLFLPFGVFLRAFPVTRWAGGLLISLAVGFYFVYPLMVNIDEAIGIPSVVKNMGNTVDTFFKQDIWEIGLLAFALRFLSFSTGYVFILGITTFLVYTFVPSVVYSVVVLGMILPIFNIFITFTFVKEFSKILGADVNLAAIMKMI